MRKKIFLITSKEECACPCCEGRLKYRDHRLRVHKTAGGRKEWCRIRRLKCTDNKCRRLHNELPDCMFPYKHYDAGLIEDADEAARREAGGIFQAVLQAAPDRAGPADNRRGINKNAFVIID